MHLGPTARRIFIVLFASLSVFNSIIAVALAADERFWVSGACLFVASMESVTACLLWAAAPVVRRW